MLAQKILNVMTKIGPIIKDKKNEEKGFDYVSLANIIIRAREAMIQEKIIMVPYKIEQIVQRGNDTTISMIYRFYDAEPNESGKNECIDVNVAGEGFDKEGWGIYKALSGAYKYAITQTFAIPTIDDAERSNTSSENDNVIEEPEVTIINGGLNENQVDNMLSNPGLSDFEDVFTLGRNVG